MQFGYREIVHIDYLEKILVMHLRVVYPLHFSMCPPSAIYDCLGLLATVYGCTIILRSHKNP